VDESAFEELVLRYLDGLSPPEEVETLNRLLRTRPDLADLFVRVAGTEWLILSAHEAPKVLELPDRPPARAVPARPAPPRRVVPARRSARPVALAAGLAAAAAALLFLSWPGVPDRPGPRPAPEPVAVPPAPPPPEEDPDAERREEERRRAMEAMARIEEENRRRRQELAELQAREQEEARRRAEEELARLEARRREAAAALDRAEAAAEEARRRKPDPAPTAAAAPVLLERAEGEVRLRRGDRAEPVRAGQAVLAGDGLETVGSKAAARLAFPDGTRVELAGETALRDIFDRQAGRGARAFVARGTVTAEVPPQKADQPLMLTTPHGEVRVLGTWLRLVVEAAPRGTTRLEVRDGRARLTRASDGKGVDVPGDHYAVAGPGTELVARPIPVRIQEAFDALPAWASTVHAVWGGAATWALAPGASGTGLQASRADKGSSAVVLVYTVPANATLDLSVLMKCPRFSGGYWMEFGYRLGSHTAQDFDANATAWTLVKKFDSYGGQNGNGNAWTRYAQPVQTGASTQITLGFKLGSAAGPGPTVGWDTVRLTQ
jgi:ferric-dicitrate binding protein FerR (iron transport regulator)